MDIKYELETGRILSCTIEGKIEKTDNVITIDDALLPADFMTMFPRGKYLVRDGEIVDKDATTEQPEDKAVSVEKKKSTKTARPKAKKRK